MSWMIVLYCIGMIIRCIVFLGAGFLAVKSKNEHKISDTVFWCTMMLIPVIQQLMKGGDANGQDQDYSGVIG